MIFCIGLLGFIVLFKKSRRTLPDHKPWQEIFSDDVLFVFVFAFCFMFYVLSRFCISAMHTASLWSNNRESDIVFTYTNFILLNEYYSHFCFSYLFCLFFFQSNFWIICFVAHLNIFSCIIKNKYYIYYFQTALVIILSNSTDELNFSVPSRHVTMKRNLRTFRAAFQW